MNTLIQEFAHNLTLIFIQIYNIWQVIQILKTEVTFSTNDVLNIPSTVTLKTTH